MAREAGDIEEATLRLLLARDLGPGLLRRLREHFGCDERIVDATTAGLAAVRGVGKTTAARLREGIRDAVPDRERRLLGRHAARLILEGDADYPPLLAAIPDPPAALWMRGRLDVNDSLSLAVVGSRRCTSYGREQAARFACHLAACGLTIVSGGALGIDGMAHRGALRCGGRTVAVLGCGLARCYPPQHQRLFDQLVEAGCAVLSELPMTAPPLGHHFPRRNRIISGLSLGVLVVEAARRSGALITARQAAEDHGREVMVVPGRVDSPSSVGGLQAARDGWAALALDHLDVLRQLEGAAPLLRGAIELAERERAGASDVPVLSDEQSELVRAIRGASGRTSAEQIAATTGRAIAEVLADITVLELRGVVAREVDGSITPS